MSNYPTPTLQLLPLRERPAHRVAEGSDACNLVELLAVIVGGPQQIEVANALLAEFGDLLGLARASASQLDAIPGLGKVGAARLKAALELGRRAHQVYPDDRYVIRGTKDAASLLMSEMSHLEQEHLKVLYLSTRNHLLGIDTVYIGSINTTVIRIAEVFRGAVKRPCAAIIVAHNHPSGDTTPSPEDIEVTHQLVAAGQFLDITVLDHLIIGNNQYVSLRGRGLGFS